VETVTRAEGSYEVVLRDVFSGQRTTLSVDAIVLGTGFEQSRIPPMLAEILPWLQLADDGGLVISRDYRVALANAPGWPSSPTAYLSAHTESATPSPSRLWQCGPNGSSMP
jgi:hypothetical protein